MLIIVEGFEMVGKTTYIKNECNHNKSAHCMWYKPSQKLIDYMDQSQRYVINLITSDISRTSSQIIFLDRGLISTWIYNKFYNNCPNFMDEQFVESTINLFKELTNDRYRFELIYHTDLDIARMFYDSALKERGENLDEYDKFDSFESYMKKHDEFMKYAKEFIEKYNLRVRYIDTKELICGGYHE